MAAAVAVPAVGACTRKPHLALLAAALVLGGAWIGAARQQAMDRSSLAGHLDHAVVARGYLVERERPTPVANRARARLTALKTPSENGRWRAVDDLVQLRTPRNVGFSRLSLGDEVELEGVLEKPANRPGSDFDYAEHLRRAGVHAVLQADAVRPTGQRRDGVTGLIDRLRRRAEAGVGAGLDSGVASLARGIVLGQDERIPPSVARDFKDSGLAHLLAVSGQNVTLLAIFALPVLAALGLGRKGRLAGVLGLIALYVPLTGAGPSVLRAGAMGAAATAATLAGRLSSRWYSLMLAAAFTLLIDPRAWLDVGWQLSFAAVVGIFCLMTPLRNALRTLPPGLAEGAAMTGAATVATAPLMAFHFQRVSLVSLLANLLALPAVAPIMWLGIAAGAVSQIWLAPAALINALSGFCLAYLAAVAQWSADLPNAVVSVQLRSGWGLAMAYGAIAVVVLVGRWLADPRRLARSRGPAYAALAGALMVVLAAAAWALRACVPEPPDRFTVSFLDVGQGDATLLQAPGGVAILVDGGPPQGRVVAKLRKAGVRTLDLVVLTHPQEDHQGGLEDVLREIPVAGLLDGGAGSRASVHARIAKLARRAGARVLVPHAGQLLEVGPIRLRVLSPESPVGTVAHERAADAGDPNDRAAVLVASYRDIDVFLPADAESDVTLGLPIRPVEILKVAHHGSADEGLTALLDGLSPEIAVIEVGAGNRFGHPATEALQALRARVPYVYRTDRHGDVRVSVHGDAPVVSTERDSSPPRR